MYNLNLQRFKVDWVLIDELSVGKAPTSDKHVLILRKAGIKSILSLCSTEEVQQNHKLKAHFICKRLILPDHKSDQKIGLNEFNKALDAIEELLEYNKPLYVHCVAAMERSPLVCMGWLVKKHDLSPQSALDYMMQIHPGTNPLPEQLALLQNLV